MRGLVRRLEGIFELTWWTRGGFKRPIRAVGDSRTDFPVAVALLGIWMRRCGRADGMRWGACSWTEFQVERKRRIGNHRVAAESNLSLPSFPPPRRRLRRCRRVACRDHFIVQRCPHRHSHTPRIIVCPPGHLHV